MQLQVNWVVDELLITEPGNLIQKLNDDFSNHLSYYYFQVYETTLGYMVGIASNQGVCMLAFCNQKNVFQLLSEISKKRKVGFKHNANRILTQLALELHQYFHQKRTVFTVPLDFVGTDFQIKVWKQLLEISYGTTCSYLQLSKQIATEKAIRAVANANAKNKISIIVPCHRVIGSNASLTGYAGGLERKQQLLLLENNQ